MGWAADWTGQLFGQVNSVRTGAFPWSASWAKDLMTRAASLFPLTSPPAAPTLTDQTRVAGIGDRYKHMRTAVKSDLTFKKEVGAGTVVRWAPGPAGSSLAGTTIEVGPDFFRATPDDQASLLLEALARKIPDVEPAFVPAYVALAGVGFHSRNPSSCSCRCSAVS